MTLQEAIVKAGNFRDVVVGTRKTIDDICRRATDIYHARIEGNDYDIIVVLESIEDQRDTVYLDEFLATPGC